MLPEGTDPARAGVAAATILLAGTGLASAALAICRFGLDSFSHARLLQLVQDGPTRDRYSFYFKHLDRTRIGVSAVSVGADAGFILALHAILAGLLGRPAPLDPVAAGLGVGLAVVLLATFSRVLPRALVTYDFEGPMLRLLPWLHRLGALLSPLSEPLHRLRRTLARALGHEDRESMNEAFADEMIATIEKGEAEGIVDPHAAEMIENAIEFRDVAVGEAMTPRTDMDWIDGAETVTAALELAAERGHARLPVGDGDADRVIGVFYVRDVLSRLGTFDILSRTPVRELCRKPYFVPESKKISALLNEFKKNKLQIAVVLDEYGGTAGLITLEDIFEEIVGDIRDEYDDVDAVPALKVVDKDRAEVDGRTHIDEINEALGLELPESGDFDTIGGFVFSHLGRVPKPGEVVSWDNVELKVLEADDRRVARLEVRVVARS